jgi:hypothetical protein
MAAPEESLLLSPFIFPPTQLSYQLMNQVESLLKSVNLRVVRFSGPLASKETAFIYLPEHNLVIYAGHAKKNAWCGENVFLCNLVTVADASIFEGKIVVANPACESAVELGPAIVQAGAKAFLGSIENMNAHFNEVEHNYMDDWFDYTLTFYRSVFTKTMGDAVEDWKNAINRYMDLYKAHLDDWPNADWNYFAAKMNRDNFVVLGDPQAVVRGVGFEPTTLRERGLLEGLSFLFNPETLRKQWNYAFRSLFSFGAVTATVAAVGVPIATAYAIERGWLTKEQAEVAKAVIPGVAAVAPIP